MISYGFVSGFAQKPEFCFAEESGCLILVDLDNMEAASTAFVLLGLIRKKVMAGVQGSVPHVLMKLSKEFEEEEREQE